MAQSEEFIYPGWEVARKLGEGSFGGVYEIRRTLPGGRVEKCALKRLTVPRDSEEIRELYAQSFSKDSITAHYKGRMEELVNEYGIMQALSGCPNIVSCHDIQYVQHDDGIGWDIYIRMELLYPLKKVLGSGYSEDMVCNLGIQLCNALSACHAENIIHRDIKPENILVSGKGLFKLGDFGIAKVSEKTGTGTLTGTCGYMAPEVANRQHYGALVDIYSLGMVLYWLMNRRTLPFLPLPPAIPTGVQRQQAQERRLSGEPLPPPIDGSEALKKVVLKACAFSPEERYRSAEEMQEALQNCLYAPAAPAGQQVPMAPPAPIAEPTVLDAPTELEWETATQAAIPQQQRRPVEKKAPEKKEKRKPKGWLWAALCVLLLGCGLLTVWQFTYGAQAAKYRDAQQLMDGGEYSAAAEAFGALEDYKDSAEKASEARNQLSLLENYQTAQGLLDAGDYKKAIEAFEALGSYNDSAEKAQEARRLQRLKADYQSAQNLLDSGKYMQAMWAFSDLDYRDSAAKVQEARTRYLSAQPATLAAGSTHTVGIQNGGTIVATGNNTAGQCDVSDWKNIVSVAAGDSHTVGLRLNGTVAAKGSNNFGQCKVSSWKDIVAIAAGNTHTVGLRADGTVVAAGSGTYGKCNVGGWKDIVAIAAGDHHTVGLRADGTVVAVGMNGSGQCDVSSWRDIVAIAAGSSHTVGIRADGTMVAVGNNNFGQCIVTAIGWKDIVAIAAGDRHTVGLRANGTVAVAGDNNSGQRHVAVCTDIIAVAAGGFHTVGLRADGTVVAVGSNAYGQCDVSGWKNIRIPQ